MNAAIIASHGRALKGVDKLRSRTVPESNEADRDVALSEQ